MGFRDLGVSDEVVQALAQRGILAPFPIQSMVWEDARAGRDTLARSKTGSGKTLGFAIPIAERLDPARLLADVRSPVHRLHAKTLRRSHDLEVFPHLLGELARGNEDERRGQGLRVGVEPFGDRDREPQCLPRTGLGASEGVAPRARVLPHHRLDREGRQDPPLG